MRIEESQGRGQGYGTPHCRADSRRNPRLLPCRPKPLNSTFGRLVVNDGKLVSRLRDGARITTGTLDKVRAYLPSIGPLRPQRRASRHQLQNR